MNHQIAMYFGHALLGNPRHEEIEARAIEWGCSIEFAILEDFDWLFTRTFKVHEDSSTFNLLFTIVANRSVQAPLVEVKYGKDNTSEVPTFLFSDNFLTDLKNMKRIEISYEMLDQIGLEIESIYGFEYLGSRILSHGESWVLVK